MRRSLVSVIAALGLIAAPMVGSVYADDPTLGTTAFPSTEVPQVGALAAGDALNSLAFFDLRGGYVAAGTAMRNRGEGTITLAGIPAGSQIEAAYLFWAILGQGPGPLFPSANFNGADITGVLTGVSADPCWGNQASFGYRADVTALVAGDGVYTLDGFASGAVDGRDPWNANSPQPMSEGASLVVVYENSTSPATQIRIYEGAAETQGALLSQTVDGFTAPAQIHSGSTTFIGADGQSVSEPGSTFNGVALPAVGWDGGDPQAGPPYSLGNLWDTMTVDVTALIDPGDSSATTTVRGGGDCLVWVAQVLSISAQAAGHPVIVVHGINADARDVMAPHLEAPILAEFGGDAIERFVYYQDKQFRPNPVDPACANLAPPILPVEPNGGMPAALDSIDPNICDSQSDHSLNAVLLHKEVHERFLETGQSVVLISNSMGAAIVRGMLSYSSELDDDVADTEVDSVVFLEGAHDGAEALVLANRNGGRELDAQIARAALDAFAGIDFTRPAQRDLTPKSDWYRWANPGADRLADVAIFNVHGNMDIVHVPCFFFWCGDPRIVMELGDIALTEGTDDPFDTPPKGGSRLLRGAPAAQNYQWSLDRQLLWLPADDPHMVAVIAGALQAPEMHGNFLNRMPEVEVADCQTGASIPVDQALLNVIRGRLTEVPYECQP